MADIEVISDLPEAAKDRGRLCELMFAVEAKRRGHSVFWPDGDNGGADVVLWNGSRFIRIQIKSCLRKEPGRKRHTFTVKRGSPKTIRAYTKIDADVLALYSYDSKLWHLIPIEAVGSETSIKLEPGGKYDIFSENWDVIK